LKKGLLIIAGEASGDLHGSELIKKLKAADSEIQIFAVGGERMQNAGAELLYNIKDLAFLGFKEVIAHIPFIKRVQKDLLKTIEDNKIEFIVLIDYPGFNLNFAKKLKRRNKTIIYYISPQIWAWGIKRIYKIKKFTDKMLVVFPFEKELYEKHNVKAEYVGHPLMARIEKFNFSDRSEFFKRHNLDESKNILLIMPGSRKHEIEMILPVALEASLKLKKEFNLEIIIAAAENIEKSFIAQFVKDGSVKIIEKENYNLMKHATFGIIKSGTSSLEAALIGLPIVVVYKTSALTYFIGKNLVKLDSIAMPNIIVKKKIIEEFVQKDFNVNSIYSAVKKYLTDKNEYEKLRSSLKEVKEILAFDGSPSERSAEIILAMMNEA
jgi:lipid-A-disaccharide synthase